MGNYLSKGYHIFMDNFFTTVPLAKRLYELGTLITGTIEIESIYQLASKTNLLLVKKSTFIKAP